MVGGKQLVVADGLGYRLFADPDLAGLLRTGGKYRGGLDLVPADLPLLADDAGVFNPAIPYPKTRGDDGPGPEAADQKRSDRAERQQEAEHL